MEDHVRHTEWRIGETPTEHLNRFPPKDRYGATGGLGYDKLMRRGNERIGYFGQMSDMRKAKARAATKAVVMTLVCTIFFLFMMVSWFYVWHSSIILFLLIFLVLLAIAGGIVYCGAQNSKKKDWLSGLGDRNWLLPLGLGCVVMTVLALILGFFLYYHYLAYYYRYKEMQTYSNVAPSQQTTTFATAALMQFTGDSRLDTMRAAGYKYRWNGKTYCVAPIVDRTMQINDPISFWAVGINCCLARSQFGCDDAEDSAATSALAVLEPDDVVRPSMQWAVRGANYPQYIKAIDLETASFFTTAAVQPKLVYWTKDPAAFQDAYWYDAKHIALWVLLIMFLILMVFFSFFMYKTMTGEPAKKTITHMPTDDQDGYYNVHTARLNEDFKY